MRFKLQMLKKLRKSISEVRRRRRLIKERNELIDKANYLQSNGFPTEFRGRDYIQERILEITRELDGR